jgi:endonuclease G
LADYKGSGYDRGHLCPAADMKLNEVSISETFFLSNMSPQDPSFNRGIWAKLESLVRDWCLIHDTLYIATGPVFKDNLGAIGADSVTIPGYFYKAIIDGSKMKTIAFVLPNAKSSNELSSFVITVDSLETLTGIDFFAGLPDQLEKDLESKADFSRWTIKESSTSSSSILHDKPIIYPTKTNNFLHIKGANEPLKISVFTSLGKCIYQTNLKEDETTLDLSLLNRGLYLIRATGVNTLVQKRIVKE